MSESPLGPFKYAGVIMDESVSGCWTNHQSVIEFKKQWYLFYHNNDLSPKFDKSRSIRADSLFFNQDGTIRPVMQTFRGVGATPAFSAIQIDRYSAISQPGVSVTFIDSLHTMKGWKTTLNESGAWIRYNKVSFSRAGSKFVTAQVRSAVGGRFEIRADNPGGPLIAVLNIDATPEWKPVTTNQAKALSGMHDLFVVSVDPRPIEIDWISFK
ncbi:carbohydrate-binding protein [Mucilaginibacter paludis]|nr:carbohydrate-binding protein [Mucilaginibacter paludis]